MRIPWALALTLSLSAYIAACSSNRASSDEETSTKGIAQSPGQGAGEAPVRAMPGEHSLPLDWLDVSATTFAARVEAHEAAAEPVRFDAASRATLVEALAQPGVPATRAAVLLAHAAGAGDEAARDALIDRLERRAYAPSRSEAAGDVVAAAALAAHAREAKLGARLAALARGPQPHPELDVRVECACAALAGGRDEVVPFLLSVLRAETPAQASVPPDWPRVTTLAWAKSRAADALAARASADVEFRADASWIDQMAAADALEAALRSAGALRG